jgi:long-chain acyl-CoA synthetase
MLTHRNIIANMEQLAAWLRPYLTEGKEVCLTPLPLDGELPEDSELTVNAIASELAGCTVYGPALYFASSKTTVKPAQ